MTRSAPDPSDTVSEASSPSATERAGAATSQTQDPDMTPRLTKTDSVKGFWWRSLPRNQPAQAEFCKFMENRLLSGYFDLDAEATALRWNAQEYTRVGDHANANETTKELTDIRRLIAERNERREDRELKQQELDLKEQELALQAIGISDMRSMATAMDRMAFQMLVGNVIQAEVNGMTLNYWETYR